MYPSLLVVAIFYASRGLTTSRKKILVALILARLVAAFVEILTTRGVAIMVQSYYPRSVTDQHFLDLFLTFLPETVVTFPTTEFFLALGALSRVWR